MPFTAAVPDTQIHGESRWSVFGWILQPATPIPVVYGRSLHPEVTFFCYCYLLSAHLAGEKDGFFGLYYHATG